MYRPMNPLVHPALFDMYTELQMIVETAADSTLEATPTLDDYFRRVFDDPVEPLFIVTLYHYEALKAWLDQTLDQIAGDLPFSQAMLDRATYKTLNTADGVWSPELKAEMIASLLSDVRRTIGMINGTD